MLQMVVLFRDSKENQGFLPCHLIHQLCKAWLLFRAQKNCLQIANFFFCTKKQTYGCHQLPHHQFLHSRLLHPFSICQQSHHLIPCEEHNLVFFRILNHILRKLHLHFSEHPQIFRLKNFLLFLQADEQCRLHFLFHLRFPKPKQETICWLPYLGRSQPLQLVA